MFFLFDRCPEFERFGAYSNNVFYHLSTNQDINVVKHFLNEGKQVKRLHLVKTTGWQHRFFDLTILSPIWLDTYECMKSSLEIFFFSV